LERRRESSVSHETVLFEQLQKAVGKWEEQAALTQLVDSALEYCKTPAASHSSNRWQVDQNDYHTISNAVYKMGWRVYEDKRYDRDTGTYTPVSWQLSWNLRTNSPTGANSYKDNVKIAGQEGKKFTDKAAMEKYLNGRIAAYSSLFTEMSPPLPQEYAHCFMVRGLLLPGYRLAADQAADQAHPIGDQGRDEKSPGTEKPSVLEQIAADRERRKVRDSASAHREVPGVGKKKGHDEEL